MKQGSSLVGIPRKGAETVSNGSGAPNEPQMRAAAWLRRVVLIVVASSWFFIPILGQVYPCEIIALVCLPFIVPLLPEHRRRIRGFALLSVIGLFCLLLSAAVNDSPAQDTLKSLLNAGFTITDFLFLYLCAAYIGSTIALPLTIALGVRFLGIWLLAPDLDVSINAWKFGGGSAATIILLAATARFNIGIAKVRASLLTMAIIDIAFFDSRSLALMTVIVALLIRGKKSPGEQARGRKRIGMFSVVGLSIAAITATFYGYTYLASKGMLTASGESRLALQNSSSPMSLLLSGRMELAFSLKAISLNPFIGYGSHALLTTPILDWAMQFLASTGYRFTPADYRSWSGTPEIPTHSFLFGSWIAGGFGAALPWFWVIWTLVRRAGSALTESGSYLGLRIFMLFSVLWSVLFSPLGGGSRMMFGISMGVAMAIWRDSPSPEVRPALRQSRVSRGQQ